VREGDTCVYWFYAVRIAEEECGITPERFAACLRAEGIGAGHSYIGKPLFLHDALRNKRVYGNSDFPFSLQDPEHAVRYEEGECPRCEQVLREMLVLPLHEAFTEADVDDIARAFEKVLAAR
jgi:dTDP-4-amino-4,6-dideoxygalactose transaminase